MQTDHLTTVYESRMACNTGYEIIRWYTHKLRGYEKHLYNKSDLHNYYYK